MKIIKSDSNYDIYGDNDITILDHLKPKQVYDVKLSKRGYYLHESTLPNPPKKIYGELPSYAEYIKNVFDNETKSVGVLLSGKPGQGKTMFAQIMHQITDLPIIKIGAVGANVTDLLNMIDEPCILLFDEYEKNFDDDDQKRMLSFFDGTSSTKFLSIITINETNKLNTYFKDRPSRIRYRITPEIPTEDHARLMLTEYLKPKTDQMKNNIEEVALSQNYNQHSYDELTTIAKELKNGASLDMIDKILNIHIYMPRISTTMSATFKPEYTKYYRQLDKLTKNYNNEYTSSGDFAQPTNVENRSNIKISEQTVKLNNQPYVAMDWIYPGTGDSDELGLFQTSIANDQEQLQIMHQLLTDAPDIPNNIVADIDHDLSILHTFNSYGAIFIPIKDLQKQMIVPQTGIYMSHNKLDLHKGDIINPKNVEKLVDVNQQLKTLSFDVIVSYL